MLDTHCHILPGVDDGSPNADTTRRMLREAASIGVTELVCTPHCYARSFDARDIARRVVEWKPVARSFGIELRRGCEVHWRALAERIIENGPEAADELCIAGGDCMLLEFSPEALPANWREVIGLLERRGIVPIIAHPEAYRPVQRDVNVARALRDAGCRLQLSGRYFGSTGMTHVWHRTGMRLLKAGLVDYVASDAHSVEEYAGFRHALDLAARCGFEAGAMSLDEADAGAGGAGAGGAGGEAIRGRHV